MFHTPRVLPLDVRYITRLGFESSQCSSGIVSPVSRALYVAERGLMDEE